jgi:photosystem II stability/assembly factor-like uncharacterized protein
VTHFDATPADTSHNAPTAEGTVPEALFSSLEYRLIGPFRGGRVVAVAGDPVHSHIFYFGSTGGGVWKTTDGGVTWENVSDGFFKRASVGALAVAPSDPNVLYAGMGEATIRGNVSHGDGVYKSTDAGLTWTHCGLADTRNIGAVRVHPENPDIVYVAALGHAHGPNAERGIFRSTDGGKTWQQVLSRGEKAGAIDLSIDPTNPRILYASFWEAMRGPHFLSSGGEGSGLFKSTDGGGTWTDISRNKGLPKGLLGKIGISASAAQSGRVYAVVEAEDGAVFRSDDWGQTWQRQSEERNLRQRAWYYHHIYADPQDPDTVWVLNVQAWKSIDGGKTFAEVAIPHGDNHDMWIDPHNSQRMIEGNDGGACVSFNGGRTWTTIYNQPTAEFYHVTTDSRTPYRVYGAQQDNSTMSVPSRSNVAAITLADYWEVGGGESGYIAVRSDNPNIIFAGNYQGYLTRYDQSTGQARNITVWPEALSGWGAKDARYRFQWTYPIQLSPHDPDVLYVTGNHVFRSTDEGQSWEVVSPDLTRNDPTTHEVSGGPLTKDGTGAEYYGTIFAFAESPLQRGLFWAGSDDGLVHVSRDGGANWDDVTPNSLPKWALISIIEPSPHDPATAYLAATAYKLDDFRPYLLKTSDYGKTWTPITTGIESNDFTRTIREDPVRRGLLYAGTETGVHVSFDDGAHWQRLKLNLPVVPIHDMVVKDSDLVLATHGRSFWILDDVTPLRKVQADMVAEAAHLYPPRDTIRYLAESGFSRESATISYSFTGPLMVTSKRLEKPTGETTSRHLDAGMNPPDGVIVTYYLKEKPEGEISLAFLDAEGNEIKSFKSEEAKDTTTVVPESTTPPAEPEPKTKEEKKEPHAAKEAGANRFVWNMRYSDPKKVEGYVSSEGAMSGPLAAPGEYQVRLTVGDQSYTQRFRIIKDPRVPASDDDLRAQFEFLLRVRDKLNAVQDAINTLRNVRAQVDEWMRRTKEGEHHEAIESAGKALSEKLSAIEGELIQAKAKSRQDTLNYGVRLNARIAFLSAVASSADARPTRQTEELFGQLSQQADEVLGRLKQVLDTDVAAFNTLIRESSVPAIVPSAVEPKGE